MRKLFIQKYDCCGCTACVSICPKQAIEMEADKEGFLYPQINLRLCVECGLCQKTCSFQDTYKTTENFKAPKVFAVKHRAETVRSNSTSGGMFTAISDKVLSCGGVVYGAGFDESMIVCHQRANDKQSCNKFRGSKYVQSEMRQVFLEIKVDLECGKKVLFTGTPCQVDGLKNFLNKAGIDKTELILCDLICHGTPSPLLFAEYLAFCEAARGKKIVNHIFRSKVEGWHAHTEMNVFSDGEEDCKSILSQVHRNIFVSSIALRPSCHYCKYTNLRRPSDITIADFWDIDKTMPAFDDNRGVSLVLINTEKGLAAFEDVREDILFKQGNIIDCMQPNLRKPTECSPRRVEFWEDYYSNGFNYVAKKYAGYGLIAEYRKLVAKFLARLGLLSTVNGVLRKYRSV